MKRSWIWAIVTSVVGSLALAGCGEGGEETSETGEETTASASCAASFAESAPDTLAQLASLSHAQGEPVLTGTYAGEEFSAEIYDNTTDGTGEDANVAPGACVVTEVSPDFGPLYLFVETDEGEWHRLLESDPKVPLVPDPEASLEDVQEVEIEDLGA